MQTLQKSVPNFAKPFSTYCSTIKISFEICLKRKYLHFLKIFLHFQKLINVFWLFLPLPNESPKSTVNTITGEAILRSPKSEVSSSLLELLSSVSLLPGAEEMLVFQADGSQPNEGANLKRKMCAFSWGERNSFIATLPDRSNIFGWIQCLDTQPLWHVSVNLHFPMLVSLFMQRLCLVG